MVTGEVSGTSIKDPVVVKVNKLTQPTIGLTLAVSTSTTKKTTEEASKRWGG
jgi:hypothetical protein